VKVDLRYLGASAVREVAGGAAMAFAPNLARSPVAFDGELIDPVRFREAISALHEVVVGDLRFKKRDKTAYRGFLAQRAADEVALRQAVHDKVKVEEAARLAREPLPANLDADFRTQHRLYWHARVKWANELAMHDPELFRHLVPCDPVVTVAPDVVMFECFAKDEASYGCLSVDRGAFRGADQATLGTTNVDYSLALFEHFQTLRTYRPTRLLVDPAGFSVAVGGGTALREEKIDLPGSWLRGFGQLQAAMALPARTLELSTDVVYSILAYLRRHREVTGPRALRFVLAPGRPPQVVLEPWGVTLTSRGRVYDGPAEEIKVWGRRRLMALARVLPLAERFDVQLLGTGLPSVWVARMGEMRLTLALSGWTANDWARGSALDQHFGGFRAYPRAVERLARHLASVHVAELPALVAVANEEAPIVLGSLHELARRGQVVYDFASGRYRWRPILAVELTDDLLGPEPEEVSEGRILASKVAIERREAVGGKLLYVAKVRDTSCEALLDGDGVISKAKCSCSHFHRNRLRAGPCRHLLALRLHVTQQRPAPLPVAQVIVRPRVALTLKLTADARTGDVDGAIERGWARLRSTVAGWTSVPVTLTVQAEAKAAHTVTLADATVAELQREAARLDVSVAVLVEAVLRAAANPSSPAPLLN
jgi:hypothetical protein